MRKRKPELMSNLDVLVKTLGSVSGRPESNFRLALCQGIEEGHLKTGKLLEPCPNPDELLAAFQEEAEGILAWLVKGAMMAYEDGNQRLAAAILDNQAKLTAAAREGLKRWPGAILFYIDEKNQNVQFRFFSHGQMKRIVSSFGMGTHYDLVRKLCVPLPNMIPVVGELHTPDDRLFRVVTQLELI